jgi:transposase
MTTMNYIGLDVHKKTISYCRKHVGGRIQQEGKIGSTRRELDCWMKTLPQPWTVAMEATISAAGSTITCCRMPPGSRWHIH